MRKSLYAISALLSIVVAVLAWNYLAAHRPVSTRLAQDPRNVKVDVWAYHRYGLLPGTLVLDLRGFSGDAAMLDVMRAVLQTADAQKDRRFERVVFSFRGTEKFQLEGDFFQSLGKEYETQNPIFTLRTFPRTSSRWMASRPIPPGPAVCWAF